MATNWFALGMANVLSSEKRHQVLVLGRLGRSLRQIEETTGVRRETASAYLKAAGVPIRPPGSQWTERLLPGAHHLKGSLGARLEALADNERSFDSVYATLTAWGMPGMEETKAYERSWQGDAVAKSLGRRAD